MGEHENQRYITHVRKEGETYQVWTPDLNIVAEHTDLTTAYNEHEKKQAEIFSFYDRIGQSRPQPSGMTSDQNIFSRLTPFFIKAVVVTLVGTILLAAGSVSLTYSLREPLRKAGLKTGRAAISSFTKGLEDFSNKELTPEKEEKIRLAIRATIPKLKPFVNELRPLFEDPTPHESSQ